MEGEKKIIYIFLCVWSQYFLCWQWRLLFCPWLLSKLTWLNWLQANEPLDWSCQAPEEVMLLHLWSAIQATAAICCLGMSQSIKKKSPKSELPRAPQAARVSWSAVSGIHRQTDMHRWAHTNTHMHVCLLCTGTYTQKTDIRTNIYSYCV